MTSDDTPSRDAGADPESAPTEQHEPEMTVVGIGASAGGLAALKALFGQMPDDTGVAFVVVVHLSPEHESKMADLLQPLCKMPVQQVSETIPIERNHVYVIPPNANLNTIDTHLRLSELEERRRDRATIDHFFRTLAETYDGDSVGVVLTGTGSDGTLGIRRIKEAGGLTVAQDPGEAEHAGMPRSAIASGMVDVVLPLKEIPAAIARFARNRTRLPIPEDGESLPEDENRVLQKAFSHIRARTGHDFSQYKRSTILRRINRRMQLQNVETLGGYLERLRTGRDEVKDLFNDLLITVTEFFRDASVYDRLEGSVIPELFEGKTTDDRIRVWSVGCSTGEEAYSLAMLLLEEAGRRDVHPEMQVFASDLHAAAVHKAREGIYPKEIAGDVSPERLRRFFENEDGHYRVRREVRELVVFAEHNLLRDPPFSHLDLIVCRNLLIYLQRDVQQDVIGVFHYALEPDGLLLLGSSEAVDQPDLFHCEDKESCLYRRRTVQSRERRLPTFPLTTTHATRRGGDGEREDTPRPQPASFGGLHERMVERYAPPSLLVDERHEVVHTSVTAARYLRMPPGESTRSVFKLVREPLQLEMPAILHTAREQGRPVRSRPLTVEIEGEPRQVAVQVHPANDPDLAGFCLVVFDDLTAEARDPEAVPDDEETAATVRELEAELHLYRRRLQAAIEEYESGREEMQATNEELQSANEELRSTLEELETSKEELQSTNEELTTVNQENRHRVAELAQASSDLQNLFAATDIATLFLDRELRIVRFTPPVGELFNVRHTDRGRPLSDITHHLGYEDFTDDARRVLDRLVPVEREIASENGSCYLTRILPYRGADDRIEGVVITLIDITARKRAEKDLHEAKDYAEKIVETLHEPLLVLHPDLTVKSANPAFYEHFGVEEAETVGRRIYDLGNGQWEIPALRELLEDVLPDSNVFNDFEVKHEFRDLGERVMLLNARRLDHVQMILVGIRDVTERVKADEELRRSEERLQRMLDIDVVGVLTFDETGTLIDANGAFLRMSGYSQPDVESRALTWRTLTPPEHVEESERQMNRLAETGRIGPYEKEYVSKDGSRSWMLFAGAALGDGTVVEYCLDVTDRKRVEAELVQAKEYAESIIETLHEPLLVLHDDLTVMSANAAFYEHFRVDRDDTVERKIYELGNGQWDIPALRELLEDVLPDNEVFNDFEVRHEFEELGERIMLVNACRLDHVQLVALSIRDVTDSRRAEIALRESEQRFRMLVQSVPDYAIFRTDDEGRPVTWNEGVQHVLGFAAEEFVDADVLEAIFTPEDVAAGVPQREFEEAARTGTAANDRWMRRKGGEHFFAEGVTNAIRDENGKLIGFTKVMRDQTELRKATDELEHRVAERTAELQSQAEQMRHIARKLAAAEHQERKRLAAHLHDDLQQLLVGAVMRIGALKPLVDGETARAAVDDARDLVQQAIDSSRNLTRQLRPPVLYEAGLVPALKWLGDEMGRLHDLRVAFDATDDEVALGDDVASLLFESVRELLLNVVKHARVPEAEVHVQREDGRLRIAVIDPGPGFDVAQAEAQAHPEGMGLFTVRERLAALGGEVLIESYPGDGTEVTLVLPLTAEVLPAEEPHAELSESSLNLPVTADETGEELRVLVVDDHAVVRQGMARVLTADPRLVVVAQAADGVEALEAVAEHRPDVVVIDVNMPRMNGIEATREITRRWRDVTVVGISVQDDEAMSNAMFDAGAVAFVSKSDDAGRIVTAIVDTAAARSPR